MVIEIRKKIQGYLLERNILVKFLWLKYWSGPSDGCVGQDLLNWTLKFINFILYKLNWEIKIEMKTHKFLRAL
jgi:hypothetical protein